LHNKLFPPAEPAFPKPFIVMPVGIAAGLGLGLILALLAEAADRRVRFPVDLEYAAPAPFLGSIGNTGRAKGRIGASRRALRAA
jgi:capsular polysaccharide biosynthesis protein